MHSMTLENDLNLNLIRIHRKQKRNMDNTLGTTVDEYEAMVNEMQLQMQMLISQAQQEVSNVESVKNQIEAQIASAQEHIVKFLNNYSQSMVNDLMSKVDISKEDLKFKGTDVYDLSFIKNLDYSKINLVKDRTLNQTRPRSIDDLKLKVIEYKTEFFWANGLVQNTGPYDPMYPLLCSQRNIMLMEYYRAKADFYNEVCIQAILKNPTNNLSTLDDFIRYNDDNIKLQRQALESQKLSLSVEEYHRRSDKIKYIERMVLMAVLRKNYIEDALKTTWKLPSFQDIVDYSDKNNVTFSRAVFELKSATNYTMLYPTWFMKIAEMYNKLQMFDEGEVVIMNPKDDRWLRKAGELVDLESGLNDSMMSFLDATVDYWALLSFSIETTENLYLEEILDTAIASEKPIMPQYPSMLIVPEYLIMQAMSEETGEFNMGGFFKKVFRSVAKAVGSIANAIVDVMKKIGNVIVKVAKATFKTAKKITGEIAGEVRKGLENTLGRVLPESVWSKIRNLTDFALDVASLNVTKESLKKAVRGIVDITLFPLRVNEEMFKFLDKQGALKYLDKYSGGLFTSYRNLVNVPMKVQAGEKINWALVLIDALKVGATAFALGSAVSIYQEIGKMGFERYMAKNATGISFIDGALMSGYLMLSGQTTFAQAVTDGSKVMGTKALVNNTGLGNSTLGRTVATMGANATVTSIATNTAFTEEARKLAEIEAKKFLSSKAQSEVLEASGIKLPKKYADKLSESVYNYATNTEIAINDDGFYKDWMSVDVNASSIFDKAQKLASSAYDKSAEAINRLMTADPTKWIDSDKSLMERAGILADDLKDGAKSAYKKAEEYANKLANAQVKVDMDKVYGLSDKYGGKLLGYLFDKYGPRFDYDSVIQPEDFLNSIVYVSGNSNKINYIKTNKANFALLGLLGAGVVGLLAFNAE